MVNSIIIILCMLLGVILTVFVLMYREVSPPPDFFVFEDRFLPRTPPAVLEEAVAPLFESERRARAQLPTDFDFETTPEPEPEPEPEPIKPLKTRMEILLDE